MLCRVFFLFLSRPRCRVMSYSVVSCFYRGRNTHRSPIPTSSLIYGAVIICIKPTRANKREAIITQSQTKQTRKKADRVSLPYLSTEADETS